MFFSVVYFWYDLIMTCKKLQKVSSKMWSYIIVVITFVRISHGACSTHQEPCKLRRLYNYIVNSKSGILIDHLKFTLVLTLDDFNIT